MFCVHTDRQDRRTQRQRNKETKKRTDRQNQRRSELARISLRELKALEFLRSHHLSRTSPLTSFLLFPPGYGTCRYKLPTLSVLFLCCSFLPALRHLKSLKLSLKVWSQLYVLNPLPLGAGGIPFIDTLIVVLPCFRDLCAVCAFGPHFVWWRSSFLVVVEFSLLDHGLEFRCCR